MSSSLLTCRCGTKNRITLGGPTLRKFRCAACKHEFTPLELMKAAVERPATPEGVAGPPFDLEPTDEVEYACPDESCGWSGDGLSADEDANGKLTCPECGKKVKAIDEA